MLPAWIRTLVAAAVLAIAQPAVAAVIASVDRSAIAADETLVLTLRVDSASVNADPDFGALEAEFEVLGTSRNSQYVMRNGRAESWTEWVTTLAPRREGQLRIPAISVGSERSAPLTVTVTASRRPQGQPGSEVFLEVSSDRQQVRVQAQLVVTVRVFHAVNFNRGASLTEPEVADAVVKPMTERSYAKIIDGVRYGVFERRYAVYPQSSGELLIPSLDFQARVSSGRSSWFDNRGNSRILRARSKELRVAVLPSAAGFDGQDWLPARSVSIVETWDRPPEELRVGESATRTVTIRAEGLLGSQLPPLQESRIDGLKIYPDQAEVSDEELADGFAGQRVQSSAVMPVRAGDFELPEVRLRWWDTVEERMQEAVIPARIIRVAATAATAEVTAVTTPAPSAVEPAQSTAAIPTTPGPVGPPLPWILACAVLAAAWLFSSWNWWRLRRRFAVAPTAVAQNDSARAETAAFRELIDACRRNDAREAARALRSWSDCWPEGSSGRGSDWLQRCDDAVLRTEVKALQEHLFGPGVRGSWAGESLAQRLEDYRRTSRRKRESSTVDGALPQLYA